jgi:hypothetical protein
MELKNLPFSADLVEGELSHKSEKLTHCSWDCKLEFIITKRVFLFYFIEWELYKMFIELCRSHQFAVPLRMEMITEKRIRSKKRASSSCSEISLLLYR